MKLKKFALFLVLVMLLASCESAFAWGNRTGSRTGDAAVYGAAGGGIAAVVAYYVAGVVCPPVGIAAGLGFLGAGAYGALFENKTIATDAAALTVVGVGSGVAAVHAPKMASWTLGFGGKTVGRTVMSVLLTSATKTILREWKKPDPNKPINVTDWAY